MFSSLSPIGQMGWLDAHFEIAPGIDLQRDVLDQMDFKPRIAADLAVMPAGHFRVGDEGLGAMGGR